VERRQDSGGDLRLGDEGEDAKPATAGARQRIDVVDALQQRGPVDATVVCDGISLGRRNGGCRYRTYEPCSRLAAGRACLVSVGWRVLEARGRRLYERHDGLSPGGVRSEDTVEADQRMARRRDESAQAGQKLRRRHDAVGTVSARCLDLVGDAAVTAETEALEAERRPGTVA
jgi:hypothetical protein